MRSQPMRSLASGPAADATDGTGTRRLPAREADGVPDGPPLVSRAGVAEPRPEVAAGPRLREQPRLGHLSEEHPTGLGRVAGHHRARHPANGPEDPGEPLAETPRPLAPRRHAAPRPRSPGRGRARLGPGAPARDHGNEAAVVDLHGPRRPVGPGVAIARRRPPRRPPPPREPADRRIGSGAGPPPRRVRRRSSSPYGAASPGPRGHAASTSGTQPVSGPVAGLSPSGASGGAGDRSSMLAYFATVLRLIPSARAISVGPAPSASIRLTRCLTPRGMAVLPFLLPAGGRGCLSRREELWAMAVPLVPGPGLGDANAARKPTGALPES